MATKTKKKIEKKVTDGSDNIEREVKITYHWNKCDGTKIHPKHIIALEETAMDRIIEMMKEGYTSGELIDNIHMFDADGEDGIGYSGWWSIDTQVL